MAFRSWLNYIIDKDNFAPWLRGNVVEGPKAASRREWLVFGEYERAPGDWVQLDELRRK